MCFPCPISDRSWTLLHAICSYIRWPWTAHICDNNPRREHAWHLFRWAHSPRIWNETTKEWFYVSNPPAEWQCYFFHNKQGQRIHWWLSGKRWFLEPVSPEWSLFLGNGSDPGEGDWQRYLSDKGAWMKNQATDDFFLARNGFSQSVTSRNGLSQWQQDICIDQQGRLVHYWFSENRWFLEPQPSRGNWVPPLGVSSCERPTNAASPTCPPGQHQSLGEQLLMLQQAGTRGHERRKRNGKRLTLQMAKVPGGGT